MEIKFVTSRCDRKWILPWDNLRETSESQLKYIRMKLPRKCMEVLCLNVNHIRHICPQYQLVCACGIWWINYFCIKRNYSRSIFYLMCALFNISPVFCVLYMHFKCDYIPVYGMYLYVYKIWLLFQNLFTVFYLNIQMYCAIYCVSFAMCMVICEIYFVSFAIVFVSHIWTKWCASVVAEFLNAVWIFPSGFLKLHDKFQIWMLFLL